MEADDSVWKLRIFNVNIPTPGRGHHTGGGDITQGGGDITQGAGTLKCVIHFSRASPPSLRRISPARGGDV